MAGETNFGEKDARVGNPLLYTRRIFLSVISSFFAQDCLNSYPGAPTNPYRLRFDDHGDVSTDSGIIISDRYSPEEVGRRPQIVVGRGAASWQDMAQGDFGQGIGTTSGWLDKRIKNDIISVPIEISVYAQNDIEAENIAWSVGYSIKSFEREVRIGSALYQIQSTTVGPAVADKVSDNVEQFRIGMQTGATIALRWQLGTTLTTEQITQGFCKISGDPFPVHIKDLCIFADPTDSPNN
jgi:hypothetical protein